jgi:predicted nuclease of predicted toxin-antitoxin system
MKILVDMNLSPMWVAALTEAGHETAHWSAVGAVGAPDGEILEWARSHGHVLFTHDLDFGAILAATGAHAPSVIQLRTQDVTPTHALDLLLSVLSGFSRQLQDGALVSADMRRSRVRVFPLK